MMNKEDKIALMADIDTKMSELYWEYRDDLTDEGGERLEEELDYLKTTLIRILERYPA